MICAHDVSRFGPNLGLNIDILESSTIRKTAASILNGFRMSGLTIDNKSSAGYRGGKGIAALTDGLSSFRYRLPTHSRALRIASNLDNLR